MYPHHRRAIERLRDRFEPDPENLALLIIGSVGRADAHERSDLDCVLVVTDEAYRRREAEGSLSIAAHDVCEYPNGEANIGAVQLQFLRAAAERGPEPVRFAYIGTIVVFSRIPSLDRLLAQIPCYPEHERTRKLISFASQLPVHLSYMHLAEYSRNPYLLAQCAVEIVLFGGRLILAHNRMLYPSRKLFLRELERAPDRPPDLLDLATHVLEHPGIDSANAFCDRVLSFADWPRPPEGHMARFQHDRELQGLWGTPALADS